MSNNPGERALVGVLHTPPGGSVEDSQRTLVFVANLVERYVKLRAKLATARAATEAQKAHTLLALVDFIASDPDALEAGDVLGLLELVDDETAKIFGNVMRGVVAAAVNELRTAGIKNPRLIKWLDVEIHRRKLSFTGTNALRWFHNIDEGKASPAEIEAFNGHRPDPARAPLDEADAMRLAASYLDTAMRLNVAPLQKQAPRRPR